MCSALWLWLVHVAPTVALAQGLSPDARVLETEQQMTDDERFSLTVGYRWYAQKNAKPVYPFGHGLSYTSFDYSDLEVSSGETITASVTVINTSQREGADVPELYLTEAPGEKRMRLLGFERVELHAGASRA